EMSPIPCALREGGRGGRVTERSGQLGDRGIVDRVLERFGAADRVVERRLVAPVDLDPTLREVLVEVLPPDAPTQTGSGCRRALDHRAKTRGGGEVPHTARALAGRDRSRHGVGAPRV